jgi:hypothetical protein
MEHSIILLLLGLALLLATNSSLLVTSGSGREDDGGKNSPSFSNQHNQGEISGSASVTSSGDVWLTIYIDHFSILAKIDVLEETDGSLIYKFSVANITFQVDSKNETRPIEKTSTSLETQFGSPDEAITALVTMFKKIGIEFTNATLKSIPYALNCGWRSPEECRGFVQCLLEKHNSE